MRKKLTLDEVKEIFLNENCQFVDNFYVNSSYLHNYICQCGNASQIRLYNFRSGKRCRKCANNYIPNLHEIKELFLSEKCIFLDNFYKNSIFSHNYQCECGNISKISLGNFKAGKRCFECSGSKKKDIEEVKNIYKNMGCIFLDDFYNGVNYPHNYMCSCGNKSRKSLSWIKRGSKCFLCSGSDKLTLEIVKYRFSKNNCEFLDDFYVNVAYRHNYRCSCGTIGKISMNSFRAGHRCSLCGEYGIDYDEKTYLYLISQPSKFKIGICNISSDRLNKHKNKGWEILDTIEYDKGHEAHFEEQRIKKCLKKNCINTGKKAFREKFDGYTEAWNLTDLEVNSFSDLYKKLNSL